MKRENDKWGNGVTYEKKYVNEYTNEMNATLLMPAGVTSIASIEYKDEDEVIEKIVATGKTVDEAYIENVLPEKMKYNLSKRRYCF